jgi:hypothetical protein
MTEYLNNSKLQIHELELNKMCKNPAIIIITKRGGGKTWVCRSLLEHFRDIPVGIIISHTEKTDPFFSNFFPPAFIYDEYKPQIFQRILARQSAIQEKSHMKNKFGKKIDTRLLLLMDDCLSNSKEWSKDESLKEILFNGRHYDITYILAMQSPMAITPELRENFDYAFLLYTDNFSQQKKLFDHYTGMFPTFNAFKEVYDKLTENYGVMVIKKRDVSSRSISDKIFHFKAKNINPRIIGCKQMVHFNKNNFDPSWFKKRTQHLFDINSVVKRRNSCLIDVEKIDVAGKAKYD